jgi:anti-sigma factor RsiW
MNCNEAGTLVAAHADGELDGLRRCSVEQHLRDCAACAAKHQDLLALRARLRAEVSYFPASPALRARVHATVEAMRAARWLSGGVLGD